MMKWKRQNLAVGSAATWQSTVCTCKSDLTHNIFIFIEGSMHVDLILIIAWRKTNILLLLSCTDYSGKQQKQRRLWPTHTASLEESKEAALHCWRHDVNNNRGALHLILLFSYRQKDYKMLLNWLIHELMQLTFFFKIAFCALFQTMHRNWDVSRCIYNLFFFFFPNKS